MKAVVLTKYGSPVDLQIQSVEIPAPKENQVLLKVKASSINDWDWSMVTGKPFYIRLLCGLFRPKISIPGVDVAGEVVGLGQGVSQFKVGDQVYGDLSESGFGAFAEYVCVPAQALTIKPEKMSYPEAAALPHASILALQSLAYLKEIKPETKLLINGAGGGVGTIGVQIAKVMGIQTITGVDSTDKFDLMRSAGFTHVIDYRQEDFTQTQKNYDLVIDVKTNRSIFKYLSVLKTGGIYIVVGGNISRVFQTLMVSFIATFFFKKNLRVLALKPNKGLPEINRLYESGKVCPIIDGPYTLISAAEAIQRFGNATHKGKVIIVMNDD